ncbi:MAG: phage tail protein [Bryobacteraceae bacterium]
MGNTANPFFSYRYLVSVSGTFGPAKLVGGFSDVSGLTVSSNPQKLSGTHKVGDVTLKRGVVDSSTLWGWITQARNQSTIPLRYAIITLRNQSNHPAQSWKLNHAVPKKYTGPILGGKGGSTAIEEPVLSSDTIEIVPPGPHH